MLNTGGGISVDETGCLGILGHKPTRWWKNPIAWVVSMMVSKVAYGWSKTQDLSLEHQLDMGIRYFDLRVGEQPSSGDLHFLHCLYANEILASLRTINIFFENNPREFVILDFNHFYNMTSANHQKLLEGIKEIFGDKILDNRGISSLSTLTLDRIWAASKQVMVIYHEEEAVPECPWVWSEQTIVSLWANTTDPQRLEKFLNRNYNEAKNRGGKFCVWQGILTLDYSYVAMHFWSSLQKTLVPLETATFLSWLRNKLPGPAGINICIIDFVEKSDYISTVINLNYKVHENVTVKF